MATRRGIATGGRYDRVRDDAAAREADRVLRAPRVVYHCRRPLLSPSPDVNPPARASTPPTRGRRPRLSVPHQRPVPLHGHEAGPKRKIGHRNDMDGKANHDDGRLRAARWRLRRAADAAAQRGRVTEVLRAAPTMAPCSL